MPSRNCSLLEISEIPKIQTWAQIFDVIDTLDNEMTFKFYRHASAYIKEKFPLHSKNLFQLHAELPGKLQVKSTILRNFQIFVKPVNFWNLSNFENYKTLLERIWKKGF